MAYDAKIGDEGRYYNAINNYKMQNAAKTKMKNWLAVDDHQELYDWLTCTGEYENIFVGFPDEKVIKYANEWYDFDNRDYKPSIDEIIANKQKYGAGNWEACPMVEGSFYNDFGAFLLKLMHSMVDYGGLTEKQTEIVRNALARKKVWVVETEARKAKFKEENMKSEFIGEVKERMEFTLKVKKVLQFDGQWGMTFINLCEMDGNQVVYKGTRCLGEGRTVKVKATVKEHVTRDDVKQTVIARPKLLDD